ncbi:MULTISPECIES: hypothetical protein [unclassified Pseudomonas]|jgi:hypothetical protein|uniref:hypothetical protein n=1 Tax=Pseudomonas TaxID=286 RepID=UPI000C880110|nr:MULTISPECIES: hypothetical protein [unclassified Pseudomonas]MBL1311273.1 hypothetical protein [Pseudomonas sp.]PMX19102.1 hypothetical protein C1Y25_00410 [Pseudomonas sp. MPBC4-3]PMX50063.1 hypothetical protein C1Y20_04125 [Pseudomonas sp. FW301-21B01]PMY10779.1 hypothetical protein C1Y18_01955 [Pseudomonas sp. MPR-R5A]PNA72946.1 hypothetical protein C1Y14_01510 [Pseudomonas sp. MPR-R5B]
MITLDIQGFQELQDELSKELAALRSDKVVTVGIHEEAGDVESGDLTMASLGAINEFGADIKHPGGTSYGYASKAAADRDEVRFLKTGKGYMELGVTQAHTINIPARPWLEPGVSSATPEVLLTIQDGMEAGQSMDQILEAVGVVAAAAVKVYMTELKTPPNAASTIRKKGSSNPLIADGHMRQSVTHKVSIGPVTEGLE